VTPGLLLNPKQIPKEVADIFSAPSDDEEFVGFQDDVPMQNLSESCGSLDSRELEKQVWVFLFKTGVALWKLGAGCVRMLFHLPAVLSW
jgi:hypothetical protein